MHKGELDSFAPAFNPLIIADCIRIYLIGRLGPLWIGS